MQALMMIINEEIDPTNKKAINIRKLAAVIFKNIVLKNIKVSF
jgi:hypothetical protein